MKKQILILVPFVALSLLGCVSAPKGPQTLALKSPQDVSLRAYRSTSVSKEYEGEQLTREKQESVDFIVESKPVTKPGEHPVETVVTTIAKSGTSDLHDYGFPEKDESIEFHYAENGKVLKAGAFQRQSLFFVPPLPLPDHPVETGDTWSLEHTWTSNSGIELLLEIVGIHKGFKRCGEDSPCVEIEVSGSVAPALERVVGLDMESRISGKLLFSLPKGEVYSSKIESREVLSFPNRKILSRSCMVSRPTEKRELDSISFESCPI